MRAPEVGRLVLGHRDAHRLPAVGAVAVLVVGGGFVALGVPRLGLHGPLHYLGVMGPLCGMTRAVTAVLRGDLAAALAYNPAGPLLVAASGGLVLRAAVGVATARWVNCRWRPARVTWVAVLLAAGALTVRQQLYAPLLQ